MIARNRNELWASVLLDELARGGLEHVVVSPGSRSTPLVLAAAAHPGIRVLSQIDERSAGFLALGIGKATGTPAAVVTTSGTAVANLLPAVVEASLSETPLLLLTADRPPWLRGADANQTIEQRGIFGIYPRLFEEISPGEVSERTLRHLRSVACRALSASVGEPGGPVHLNLPFAKPLEPTPVPGDVPSELSEGKTPASGGRSGGRPWTTFQRARPEPAEADLDWTWDALRRARAPVMVAGVQPRPWEVGPILRDAAYRLRVPLLADPLSGARYGSSAEPSYVIGGYDLALSDPVLREALAPDLVLRFGAAPTSAALGSWIESLEGVEHICVSSAGRWKDHASIATRMVVSDSSRFVEALLARASELPGGSDGAPGWIDIETDVFRQLEASLPDPSFEGGLVNAIVYRMNAGEHLFVSNSMPVRDLSTFVPRVERELAVFGNRGASGIDGIVSTAAGVSLGSERRVVGIVGDVALLHDSNGLAALREPGVRVLLVVLNNDGGGIFHGLPVRAFEPAFTPLIATPHGRDLGGLARFHDLPHVSVDVRESGAGHASELEAAWESARAWQGSGILEIRTDRDRNQTRRTEVVESISSSLGAAAHRGGA